MLHMSTFIDQLC